MINEVKLRECCGLIKERCPEHKKQNVFSMVNWIMKECQALDFDVINITIAKYFEKDLFEKPLIYFRAIAFNIQREKRKKKEREMKELGTVPLPDGLE